MPKFDIYFKAGQKFSIVCQSVEKADQGFTLTAAKEGFVWLQDLTAIVTERRPEANEAIHENVWFDVWLKDHSEPVKVWACSFATAELAFKVRQQIFGPGGSVSYSESAVEPFLYLDHKDVLAVVPGKNPEQSALPAIEKDQRTI